MLLLENEFRGAGLGSLFHHPAFFRHHSPATGLYFEGFDRGEQQLCLHIAPVEGGRWRSPVRGTYCGYAVAPALRMASWLQAHRTVEQRAWEAGARELEFLLAPQAHDEHAFAREVYVMASAGFALTRADMNYALRVDARPLHERMAPDHRRRWRNREVAPAAQVPVDELADIYAIVEEGYRARGIPLSMSLEQLEAMRHLFPDRMHCFASMGDHARIAGAICLRLAPGVLYIFCWSARPGHEDRNPMIALADGIYRYCQQAGIALLDCGTATVGGEPNEGLMRFKQQLGFAVSVKLRFSKVLGTA